MNSGADEDVGGCAIKKKSGDPSDPGGDGAIDGG